MSLNTRQTKAVQVIRALGLPADDLGSARKIVAAWPDDEPIIPVMTLHGWLNNAEFAAALSSGTPQPVPPPQPAPPPPAQDGDAVQAALAQLMGALTPPPAPPVDGMTTEQIQTYIDERVTSPVQIVLPDGDAPQPPPEDAAHSALALLWALVSGWFFR